MILCDRKNIKSLHTKEYDNVELFTKTVDALFRSTLRWDKVFACQIAKGWVIRNVNVFADLYFKEIRSISDLSAVKETFYVEVGLSTYGEV